jgi:hypothetical protein
MTTWSDHSFSQRSGAERDHDPGESRAGEHSPGQYVTEISVPSFDDGRQALYSPGLREPEPEAGAMTASPLGIPVSDLTQSQLWAADIRVTEDAYIDEFTGREMDPNELVRVPCEISDPAPELGPEAGS